LTASSKKQGRLAIYEQLSYIDCPVYRLIEKQKLESGRHSRKISPAFNNADFDKLLYLQSETLH
jgi:hypothetical protein